MTNSGQRPDPAGFEINHEMDLLFGRAHPNPTREGCPPAEMLTRLARRELPIGEPAYHHLSECSPCYQEVRAVQQADAARLTVAAKRRRLGYAAAAVLALTLAGSWFAFRQTPSTGTAPAAAVEQVATLDLRPFTVTRGTETPKEPDALVLARARLKLTILLPVGSEPGEYAIQILDAGGQPRATSAGTATIIDFVTTLTTTLDTSALPPGRSQLAVRREEENWRIVTVELR